MKQFVRSALPLLIVTGLVGCALEGPDGAEPLGEDSQAILNGTTVTTDTWGSPSLPGCSGTLLRDRWLLTAKHCGVSAGTTISLLSGATATLTNPIFNHPTLDVTIARVSASLIPSGAATTNGPFQLYRGSTDQLLNKTLFCQGWGAFSCPGGNCTGGGTLRSASLLVDQVNSTFGGCAGNCFRLTMNASGQLEAPGDSGSSCLLTPGDTQKNKVTGVLSGWDGSTKDYHILAPRFRDWASGIIGAAPSIGALTGFERADLTSSVAYVNSSNHVIELSFFSNWGRSDLTSALGTVSSSSNTSALVRSDGYSSIVFRSSDNHIREIFRQHGGGLGVGDLSALTGAAAAAGNPAAYGRSDQVAAVVYRGTDNRIRELSLVPGFGWGVNDLLSVTGAPLAAGDPVGYVRADTVNAVVYRSSDNHIRELSLAIGGSWQTLDLSATTGAVAATGKPFPYTRSDGVSVVLFRSSDNHVRELALVSGTWFVSDLTVAAGAPIAASDPIAYVRSDGISVVLFKGTDNRIRELSLSALGWGTSDLMTASGGPAANGVGLGAFVRADRANSVIYRTSDNHVHELKLAKGGSSWQHNDLTVLVGGDI
jgi:hypothetical protein